MKARKRKATLNCRNGFNLEIMGKLSCTSFIKQRKKKLPSSIEALLFKMVTSFQKCLMRIRMRKDEC